MFRHAIILFIVLAHVQRWIQRNEPNGSYPWASSSGTLLTGSLGGVVWGVLFALYTYRKIIGKSAHKIVSPEMVGTLMRTGVFHHLLSTSAHTMWMRYTNAGVPFWTHLVGIIVGSILMTHVMGQRHKSMLMAK